MQSDTSSPRKHPRTIFKPRTRKPNFLLSVLVTSLRMIVLLVLIGGLAGAGALLGVAKAYMETAPTLDLANFDEQAQTSFIYDAQGNLITDYKGTEDRVLISIQDMPTHLQNAFVAVEDARFFMHNGVDVKRIVGAFVSNIVNNSQQGGSTITQQLIKNRMLSAEQSYKRKIQEAYLALQLEARYSKEQILESYLNTIFLGDNYYGVKTAAMGYFGKELSELTLRECAMLAGMTRNPYYYNPRRNFYSRNTPDSNTVGITNNRTDYVLRSMYENQLITQDQYRVALDPGTATVLEHAPGGGKAMYDYAYYVEYAIYDVVSKLLELNQLEDTVSNRYAMEQKLRTSGYRVYLCVDPEIQTIVEDTLATWDKYPRLRDPSDKVYQARNADGTYIEIPQPQAAAAVVDYRTGELKAIVGGRYPPTQKKTLNRAWEMRMPVGSSIKPISVYAPAIELGASPASIIYNMPIPIKGWRGNDGEDSFPKNYGGGGYSGPETLRKALKQSHNTAAAQTLMTYVGVDASADFLRQMGVADRNINADGFGLALGSSGITPIQMAAAFGTLGNSGVYQQPLSFSRIEDSNGNVLVDSFATQAKRQVFRAGTAWMTVDMMKNSVTSGTSTKAKISSQTVAGKTGTNSDYKGVFFAGLTGWYSAAVWVGHDNYKALSSSATGGDYAAPLWQAFMEKIHKQKGLSNRDIVEASPEELGLVKATTCAVSGQLATSACKNDVMNYGVVTDWWQADRVPSDYCTMHQILTICPDSGMLASQYCPNPQERGVVMIPRGHPLYDYTRSYANVLQQYLGDFASIRLGDNSDENAALLSENTCTLHAESWQPTTPTYNSVYVEGQSLVAQAYTLLTNRGYELSTENYQQVSSAIRNCESALYNGSVDLYSAVQSLRNAVALFQ